MSTPADPTPSPPLASAVAAAAPHDDANGDDHSSPRHAAHDADAEPGANADAGAHSPRSKHGSGMTLSSAPASPEGSLGEFSDYQSAASVSPPRLAEDQTHQHAQRLRVPGTEETVAPSSLRSPARLAGLHLSSLSSTASSVGTGTGTAAPAPASTHVSLSPVTFTPAVHRDTASLSLFSPLEPSTMPVTGAAAPGAPFTPFTPFTPAVMSPPTDGQQGAAVAHTGAAASIASSSSALSTPGAMVSASGALTPAATSAGSRRTSGVLTDAPLNYSAQYSPNAATRTLMEKIAAKQQSRSSGNNGSGGVACAADMSAASAAAAAAVSAASPAPSAAPQRSGGFLSSLFGWGSGSSSRSSSVPSTPNEQSDTASAPPPSFPHTTTNAPSLRSSASTSSFALMGAGAPPAHSGSHRQTQQSQLSSSASHPSHLSSILSDSRRGSGIVAGAQHAARTPVSGHPLLVHQLTPLSSREHSALLSYSQRLKSSLHAHEGKIAKLQSLKKKYQLSRNEETAIWNKFAISSLVSIAAGLYHTQLLKASALLQLEFSFTAELSQHLNQVQLVLDAKLPLATLLDDIENRVEAYLDEQEAQIDAAMAAAAAAAAAIAAEGEEGGGGATPSGPRSRAGSKEAAPSNDAASAVAAERKKREAKAHHAMRDRRRSSSTSSSTPASSASTNTGGSWVAGAAAMGASVPALSASPSPLPSTPAPASGAAVVAARPRSLSSSELKSRFLTSAEIEGMFWPRDSATVEEQVGALAETAAKLERTYKEMQRKALSQTDSKQSRTFKLHSLLVRQGLESEWVDAALAGEMFYLPLDVGAQRRVQVVFNQLMLDQRCEEGKIVSRWIERMHALLRAPGAGAAATTSGAGGAAAGSALSTSNSSSLSSSSGNGGAEVDPKGRVTPELILGFLEFMRDEIFHKYNLSAMEAEREAERAKGEEKRQMEAMQRQMQEDAGGDGGGGAEEHDESALSPPSDIGGGGVIGDVQQQYTLRDPLSLYLSRMLFPKLGQLVSSLRTDREADLDAWYAKKLCWVRKLTRAQLGLNKFFLPPGTHMHEQHAFEWQEGEDELAEGMLGLGMAPGVGIGVGAGVVPAVVAGVRVDDGSEASEEEGDVVREAAPLESDEDLLAESDSGAGAGSVSSSSATLRSRLSCRNSVTRPFQSAMALLHRLNAQADTGAPIDLLFMFIRTVREITRLANAYLEMHRQLERKNNEAVAAAASAGADAENAAIDPSAAPGGASSSSAAPNGPSGLMSPIGSQQLNADNMFPLVLYVVIHSGVTCPHFIIGTLQRFLPQSALHFGTTGYSLILVESAVAHVCDISKDSITSPQAHSQQHQHSPHKKKKQQGETGSNVTSPSMPVVGNSGLLPLSPADTAAAAAFCSPKSRAAVSAAPSPALPASTPLTPAPAGAASPCTPMPPLPATPAASPLTPGL